MWVYIEHIHITYYTVHLESQFALTHDTYFFFKINKSASEKKCCMFTSL